MKVLLAGATGAVGRPLLSALAAAGHEVLAIIRDPAKSALVTARGAEPVHADVLDRDGLLRAVDGLAADVVMHQATALKDVGRTLRADDPTIRLRDEGTRHLLEAAGVVGAGRFVAQSLITGYGYRDHGTRLVTEDDEFGEPIGNVGDVVVASSAAAERQPLEAPGIESVALRYGMFYGPGGSATCSPASYASGSRCCRWARPRSPVSSTWRTPPRPRWRPWNAAGRARRTTWSTMSR